MPELPEVETICRGIEPLITGKRIEKVDIFQPNLRWKVNADDFYKWVGWQTITAV